MTGVQPTSRTDWDGVVTGFRLFFDGLGEVEIGAEHAVFRNDTVGTGFDLRRDGTSTSFMPLHNLELRWDAVTFDRTQRTVSLTASGATYVYRVPPQLLDG